MKRIILIIVWGLLLSSCHKDLDITQTSQLSSSSMWTDENDAIAAMFGIHEKLRSAFSHGLVYWGEYRTGLWGPGNHGGLSQTARDQVYQNIIPNTHTYADWGNLYGTINMANLVLKYTPDITFSSDDKKNEVLANAYYARALCYYWIARIWGDAPLVLEGYESANQDLLPVRAPVANVFTQVGADIDEALDLMPSSVTAKKTASNASINLLKADYNLWMFKVMDAGAQHLTLAQDAVTEVLQNSTYGLESDYDKIFDTSSEEGREIIYAWNYKLDEYTGGYPVDYQFNSATVSSIYHFNPIAVGTGQQWTFYTDEYVKVITEKTSDKRILTNYLVFNDNLMNQTFHWTNKYKGSWVNNTLVLDADIILYRLADAYLLDSEIKAEISVSEAIPSLNAIAKRAYGVDNYYPSSMSKSDFVQALVKERMKEFPSEGKLWWDFIRLGVVFDKNPYLQGKENQQNILLWPLSQKSINDNPNLGGQTPGWE